MRYSQTNQADHWIVTNTTIFISLCTLQFAAAQTMRCPLDSMKTILEMNPTAHVNNLGSAVITNNNKNNLVEMWLPDKARYAMHTHEFKWIRIVNCSTLMNLN